MSSPRVAPLEPPYTPELQADFDKVMRGQPPLKLFRTVAHNPRVLSRMMAGGLLDRGSISVRLRELMILRTTARCGAEYEWGVHVAAYGHKCEWAPHELHATVHDDDTASCWAEHESLVIRLADALHDTDGVDDALWAELRGTFKKDQLIELLMLAGLYHGVSFLVNALRVECEDMAPRFSSVSAPGA